MKTASIIPLLILCFFTIKAQEIKTSTFAQIEERVRNGKDTTYVINFWATWCGPCIKEMPYFEQLQQKYKQEKVKVIFVSVDFQSQLSKVKSLITDKNIQSEVLLLTKKSDQEFIDQVDKNWGGAIPATLFLNSAKNIRKFYEQEFSFTELEKTYQSLK